jgi:hypothetical protein
MLLFTDCFVIKDLFDIGGEFRTLDDHLIFIFYILADLPPTIPLLSITVCVLISTTMVLFLKFKLRQGSSAFHKRHSLAMHLFRTALSHPRLNTRPAIPPVAFHCRGTHTHHQYQTTFMSSTFVSPDSVTGQYITHYEDYGLPRYVADTDFPPLHIVD